MSDGAYRILLVEDDPGIAEPVAAALQRWGFETRCARDFRNIDGEFREFQPHLTLMDIALPFFNGYHWCAEIRRISSAPVLFLSSASDKMNQLMAMNMGADDFLPKPFDMDLLIAKVQALLRRAYAYGDPAPQAFSRRGAQLDTGRQALLFGGQVIALSRNEYRILFKLMENAGRVVSREDLMQSLWETDTFVDENTLSVNVNRLRRRLEATGLHGFIATRVGAGYIIE